MLNAEQALHLAVTQAMQFLQYEGLSTRGQEARRILQNALVAYAQETAAERGRVVAMVTTDCDLSEGQLR